MAEFASKGVAGSGLGLGIAGTALGYGIANNNQINRPPCCGWQPMPFYPQQQFPNFNSSNNFYY